MIRKCTNFKLFINSKIQLTLLSIYTVLALTISEVGDRLKPCHSEGPKKNYYIYIFIKYIYIC